MSERRAHRAGSQIVRKEQKGLFVFEFPEFVRPIKSSPITQKLWIPPRVSEANGSFFPPSCTDLSIAKFLRFFSTSSTLRNVILFSTDSPFQREWALSNTT